MSRRAQRLLAIAAICWFAPSSVWPASAEVEHHNSSGCPYQRAREAAAATAVASSAAFSFFELSRSAGGLTP